MTAATRKALAENPAIIDPRKFLAPARDAMKEMYIHKMKDVLGCAGKAIKTGKYQGDEDQ
jgi:fructose-bisphosphate aldolase class II